MSIDMGRRIVQWSKNGQKWPTRPFKKNNLLLGRDFQTYTPSNNHSKKYSFLKRPYLPGLSHLAILRKGTKRAFLPTQRFLHKVGVL